MIEPRPLKIGVIAPPWVSVPPPVYGGTELVVDVLVRGLAAAGHDVELFTTGDSTCPVRRKWLFGAALGTTADPSLEHAHVREAYEVLSEVDLVHDHTWAGPPWALQWRPDLPVVTTNHGPFHPEARAHFGAIADRVAVVAISHAQRRGAPDIPVAGVIHHGLELGRYPLGTGAGGYLVFLGRMSPDKGVHRAIEVARRAGWPLLIAAKMWEPAERRYFAEVVEPLLGADVVYVGEVAGDDKLRLLGDAAALVNPIAWPEPFGLVMVEAMACGTPVLAFPHGAAPEIVDHGRTGFLCMHESDMAERVADVVQLDRGVCRASVAARFSAARFVEQHVELYRRVLSDRRELVG